MLHIFVMNIFNLFSTLLCAAYFSTITPFCFFQFTSNKSSVNAVLRSQKLVLLFCNDKEIYSDPGKKTKTMTNVRFMFSSKVPQTI